MSQDAPARTAAELSTAANKPFNIEKLLDSDIVTVLFGYGRVRPFQKSYIDNTTFTGGVARVPWGVAKYWVHGTRHDNMPVVGRVKVTILPEEATEADYIKATGIRPMPAPELAAHLIASDPDAVLDSLGDQAGEFLAMLQSRKQERERQKKQTIERGR